MIQTSAFQPPAWLRNPHLQTLWPALLRRPPAVAYRRERIALADGDWLELAWGPERGGPLVVLLHGLAGCADSGYARGLVTALGAAGMTAAVMQLRGANGLPNRQDRFFHAAETDDLDETLWLLSARFPSRPLAVVGFSLGGSIVMNWLAARGERAVVHAACAVSVPFDLGACADALDRGICRIYQYDLLRVLRQIVRSKFADRETPPVDLRLLAKRLTLREFDDAVTAPLHGFDGVDDYYRRASCSQRLHAIRRPTLILQAADDPFVPDASLPSAAQLSQQVTLELSAHGGHVGFVGTGGQYWLEQRIPHFLRGALSF